MRMWLLWIAIALFLAWIGFWIAVKAITAASWILLGFACAFLIVHLFVRAGMRRSST